jgi:hypothetical protein
MSKAVNSIGARAPKDESQKSPQYAVLAVRSEKSMFGRAEAWVRSAGKIIRYELDPAIDTSGEMGKVILTVLGMVSQMELTFIKERQRAGIDKAMAAGKYKGRPVTVDRGKVVTLIGRGVPYADVAKVVGCSRAMVYRVVAEHTVSVVKFLQQATDQSAERPQPSAATSPSRRADQ